MGGCHEVYHHTDRRIHGETPRNDEPRMLRQHTLLATSTGALGGSLAAAAYDIELGAIGLAVLSVLGVLCWAWLRTRLDNQYVTHVSCAAFHLQLKTDSDTFHAQLIKDSDAFHAQTIADGVSVRERLNFIASVLEKTTKDVTYLRGRFDGMYPSKVTEVQSGMAADVAEILVHQLVNEKLAAMDRKLHAPVPLKGG